MPRSFTAVALAAGLATGLLAFTAPAQVAPSTKQGAPVAAPSAPSGVPAELNALNTFLSAHRGVDIMRSGDQINRVFGAPFSTGVSPAASADAFIEQHSGIFGVPASDFAPVGPFESGEHLVQLMPDREMGAFKFTGVYYTQTVQGIPVFRSHLVVLVRNTEGFPAVMAASTLWPSTGMDQLVAGVNSTELPPASIYTRQAFKYFGSDVEMDPAQYVIWAGVDRVAQTPRLAVMFEAQGGNPLIPASFQRIQFVVDAANGDILYQENRVYDAVGGQVQVNATSGSSADACAAEMAVGMPYAEIKEGSNTYYADVDGFFTIPASGTLTYTTRVAGQFFTVSNNGAAPLSLSNAVPNGGNWSPVFNADNTAEEDRAQVNAYLHANLVRDMVLDSSPTFPSVSTQGPGFLITVNIANTCNANYSNSTINFFHSGGGCNNTAFGTVVHHEYGHNVVDKAGSGQGAYGEGTGDVLGVLMTDQPLLGVGFQSCASGLRNANNSCQYLTSGCSTCGSAIHSCGQLMSGCVWSLRNELLATHPATYRQILNDLAINAILLHVGSSTIEPDIVVDYLTLDDDNGDINDGTPHYSQIASAFGAHSMPAPALAAVKFTYPNGRPDSVLPAGGTQIAFKVEPLSGFPAPGSARGFVKLPGSAVYVEYPVASTGTNAYSFSFPAGTCGGEATYYFSAMSTGGATVTSPGNFPTSVFSTIMAATLNTVNEDTFEVNSGWTGGVAGDTASTGVWVRTDPVGTTAQPEDDHTPTPGVNCWVTGNAAAGAAAGSNDVDGGYTTLLSPAFNLLGMDGVYVSYWRWYSNDQGGAPNADVMPIEISANNGATWTTLETVSENAGEWVYKQFNVNSFITPTAQVRFRFRAQDLGTGSLVEAAIDDFKIIATTCTSSVLGDLNNDGIVDGADLGILLGGWGQPGPSDLNNDGTTDGADLGILLGQWS